MNPLQTNYIWNKNLKKIYWNANCNQNNDVNLFRRFLFMMCLYVVCCVVLCWCIMLDFFFGRWPESDHHHFIYNQSDYRFILFVSVFFCLFYFNEKERKGWRRMFHWNNSWIFRFVRISIYIKYTHMFYHNETFFQCG